MDAKKPGSTMSAEEKAKLLDNMDIGFNTKQVASEEEVITDFLKQTALADKEELIAGMEILHNSTQTATEEEVIEKYLNEAANAAFDKAKQKEALLSDMDIASRSTQIASEDAVIEKYLGEQSDKTQLLEDMDIGFKTRQTASEAEVIEKYQNSPAASAASTSSPPGSTTQSMVAPVAINSLNTLVIPSLYELTSEFAQAQLFEMARQLAEVPFIMIMKTTFGTDVPVEAYQQFYRDVSDKKIINPYIFVSEELIHGHVAGFDQDNQEIVIAEPFLKEALENDEKKAQLFAALIEEYGHYLDYLLRNTYSTVGGDAAGDEGAKFSYNLMLWDVLKTENIAFADVLSPQYTGPLELDNSDLSRALASVDIEAQLSDDKIDQYEFFGAGIGDAKNPASYGHQSIEFVLSEVGFDAAAELPRIYFGNWLRDFSQMVDPAFVRPTGEALKKIQKDPARAAQLDTMRLSRKAMTRFIGLLAAKEFGRFDKAWAKSIYQKMTPDILGVYRPEEHIDNPKGLANNAYLDPDFVNAPTTAQLAINPTTNVKNYIATPTAGQSFPTSLEYMVKELKLAMQSGRSDQGFLHFGQALHVLEDFYSHSNYVELCIIKLGQQNKFATPELNALARKVQPRVDVTGPVERIPLVTGRFGQFDVLASVGPKISGLFDIKIEDYLSNKAESKAKREEVDLAVLILLEDLAEAQQADTTQKNKNYLGIDYAQLLADFRWFIGVREELIKRKEEVVPRILLEGCYYLVSAVMAIANFSLYMTTELIAHSIDDAQTLIDTTGTDPTHSQLAKDHDDHPLHELAALLARAAVREVGENLVLCWKVHSHMDAELIGKKFIAHPRSFVLRDDIILSWVNSHEGLVRKATYPTVLHEAHEHIERGRKKLDMTALDLYKQYLQVKKYFTF